MNVAKAKKQKKEQEIKSEICKDRNNQILDRKYLHQLNPIRRKNNQKFWEIVEYVLKRIPEELEKLENSKISVDNLIDNKDPLLNHVDYQNLESKSIAGVIAAAQYFCRETGKSNVSIEYQDMYIFGEASSINVLPVQRQIINSVFVKRKHSRNRLVTLKAIEMLINLKRIENHRTLIGQNLTKEEQALKSKLINSLSKQEFLYLIKNCYNSGDDTEETKAINEIFSIMTKESDLSSALDEEENEFLAAKNYFQSQRREPTCIKNSINLKQSREERYKEYQRKRARV